MSEWKSTTLKEMLVINESGSRPKGGVRIGENNKGVPSYGGENISMNGEMLYDKVRTVPTEFALGMSKGILDDKDVLINKDGANTGKTAIYKRPVGEKIATINEHLFRLRCKNGIADQEFLFHYLNSEFGKKQILLLITGSAQPGLNSKFTEFVKIELPPLPEQKKIAEILSSLDSLIIKMENLFLKKKIYGENLINEIIKNDSTQKIYSAHELIKNGHILKIKDGNHGSQYPRTHEFSKSGIPFLNASSITSEGEIDFKNCPCLPEKMVQTMNIPPAVAGDVILTHNASVGKVTIIPQEIDKVVVSTSTTFYRLNQKLLNNNYLAAFLKSPIYQTQLLRIMGQTTRNQVPITAQKELKISVPSMLVQEKISSIYNHFSVDLKLQYAKLNKLKLLKQSLSNDLLSGAKIINL